MGKKVGEIALISRHDRLLISAVSNPGVVDGQRCL